MSVQEIAGFGSQNTDISLSEDKYVATKSQWQNCINRNNRDGFVQVRKLRDQLT